MDSEFNTSQDYKSSSVEQPLKSNRIAPVRSEKSSWEQDTRLDDKDGMYVATDQLDNYAETIFKLWQENPGEESELSQFSLFVQINHDETDIMANMEEIDQLLEVANDMQPFGESEYE